MIDKDAVPSRLLWVDLEMTGLEVDKDVILEIAAEVTDFNFKTLVSYEANVKHPKEVIVKRMQQNKWWADFPANRDEFLNKVGSGKDLKDIERELLSIIQANFGDESVVLAGNSIHNDRAFIKRYWPELDLRLHYRMLDVSSWKVLMQGKFSVFYEKKEVHRAFDDIQASIAELQYYIEWLKSKQ